MKRLIFNFLLFFLSLGYSQINKITYSIKSNLENKLTQPISTEAVLLFNTEESLYKQYISDYKKNDSIKMKDSTANIKFIHNIDTAYIYKNYNRKTINSQYITFGKKQCIQDSLNIFNWKLTNQTQKILDYNCNTATTSFRGRNYKVYFYKNKKHHAGPFKFDGLPGLILKFEVTDANSTYIMEATNVVLDLKNSTEAIFNPYANEKTISYEEFKQKYNQKINALKSYFTENGDEIIFQNGDLEKILNE